MSAAGREGFVGPLIQASTLVYCNFHQKQFALFRHKYQEGELTMKRMIAGLCLISLLSVNGFAYGDRGHQLVGAIADARLARNQAAAKALRKLLPNLTLEDAAILPDKIRD